jgi:hypothetical protein
VTVTAAAAARNNAELCELVCGAGWFADGAWTSPVRTPPLYPDAVTLRPGVDPRALLDRVDASPGCSVKDSFADLDLAPFGFTVLFDAEWIVRPADAAGDPTLAAGVLHEIGADEWSARLNRSDDCVGVSNVATAERGDADATWAQVVRVATTTCPGVPIVGYESGADLAVALRHGFTAIGPLRVWIS